LTPELEERLRRALHPELEVLRKLGEGAHSLVFLAREPALQRLDAVKVLRPELAADSVMQRRFEREGRAAARIAHPNVATVYRVGRVDELPYIVMEYIDGRSLEDTLAASGPLRVEEAKRVLASVSSALAAAHARGIVHRDVRPGNVFLEKETGRAVLTDFGVAGLLETGGEPVTRLTSAGERLGQLRYMSPEQIRGEPTTEQSDVYALGLVAHEALTGREPFGGGSMAESTRARLAGPPPSVREVRPEIDDGTAATIQLCLAAEPNRRPRAADLAPRFAAAPSSDADGASGDPIVANNPLAVFLVELKRRRVYRVLVGYCAFAFVALQAVQLVLPALPIEAWFYPAFVSAVLAGLPISGVLAWLYDFTATGIRRTRGRPREEGAAPRWRLLPWLGLAIVVVAVAAVGLFLLQGRR
jgi:serine/threonine protein kinase